MKRSTLSILSGCMLAVILIAGCNKSDTGPDVIGPNSVSPSSTESDFPIKAGKYTILDIRTDNNDLSQAKSNAEAAISLYPDLKCMVGLWAYNPPAILQAIEESGKQGEISIVGFDEDAVTLKAIEEGKIEGTIVQDPFAFGYKSVEYLSALIREQPVDVPENKMIFIPFKVIQKENVKDFKAELQRISDGKGTQPTHDRDDYDIKRTVSVAFLTNTVDPFWDIAEAGVRRAEPVFNATCEVYHPPQATIEEQQRFVEKIQSNEVEGLAISPIDPKNQTNMINELAEKMVVICHDSDAPNSKRLFYVGTGNYLAGRAAGKLVKQSIPDGGEVMIFVGKMEVLNAQERSQGVIDELLGKPMPGEEAETNETEASESEKTETPTTEEPAVTE
ncbi:MAG: substrate-binding domain-containing protein [Pirellulales bacterium]